jgi:hypothetical protein
MKKEPDMKVKQHVIPSLAALALALPAIAAVPHRWTVETSRIQPEQIEAYRGETIALEATLNAYGKPLETPLESPVYLYWQTNGMGAVYWVTNAAVAASNVLAASFLPSFAPAVSAVQGFIGSPSSSYRASFVIRFRNAPGETPNVLPLPAQAIDFDTITVYNPPYYTKDEVDEKVANATPSDYETVKTKANSAVQPADLTAATKDLASRVDSLTSANVKNADPAHIFKDKPGTMSERVIVSDGTNSVVFAPGWISRHLNGTAINFVYQLPSFDGTLALQSDIPEVPTAVSAFDNDAGYLTEHQSLDDYLKTADLASKETDPTVSSWAKATTKPSYTASEVGAYSSSAGTALANRVSSAESSIATINSAGYVTKTTADAAYYPKASGDAWSTYWDGDDVRVTVTNYDSVAHLPSLYLEQRTNDTASASDDTNAFRVVWREMAHWDAFLGSTWDWEDATWQGFDSWRTSLSSQLDEKADRAWGFYDSHTGEYAPDGYTSISSSNVMICAGASYQKTATATCDVWVLTANEPYEPTGVSTNGGFQIKDADGNVQFEIVKGDKRTVKAQANATSVENDTTLVVTYNIVADSAPTGEVCLDLKNAAWKSETDSDCPATVVWSGSSGAWVARITPKSSSSTCFFKATYQVGGDTYVNNRCAVGMSQLVLNGTTYNLGTAVIDGHIVLTLTPAN